MMKKKSGMFGKAIALILSVVMIMAGTAVSFAAESDITVTLSFDCSSLGTEEALDSIGFDADMSDISVDVPQGSSVAYAIEKASEEHPDAVIYDEVNKYIGKAYGLGNALSGAADKLGLDPVPSSPYNYNWAGWIFSVDGEMSGIGAADYTLNKNTEVDFRYQLIYKEDGAYDWDFTDAYETLERNIEEAENLDTSDFTSEQEDALTNALTEAKTVKNDIDEASAGLWAIYFQEIGTNLYGNQDSPIDMMQAVNKEIEAAMDKKAAPEKIIADDNMTVYIGRESKIKYEIIPEGASQDVSYEILYSGIDDINIDENGYVYAGDDGTAVIQIKSTEDSSVSKSVTIKAIPFPVNEEIEKAYADTGEYISSKVSVDYDDWMVMGLARSGMLTDEQKKTYYEKTVEYIKSAQSGSLVATDYARMILGMTAAGLDVTDVEGTNLLEPLADLGYVTRSGVNSAAYVLIALDSHDYKMPQVLSKAKQTERSALIEYLLDAEIKGAAKNTSGGWNLDVDSNEADSDITGIVLQALAPYYDSDEKVKNTCDRALNVLSEMQVSEGVHSGAFDSKWSGENACSTAEVIVALTSLGIDPEKDIRFVKNGNSAIDGLQSFAAEGGGYFYGDDTQANGFATKQGYYAMVSYFKFLDGKSLYDMTDVDIEENPVIAGDHESNTGENTGGSGQSGLDQESGPDIVHNAVASDKKEDDVNITEASSATGDDTLPVYAAVIALTALAAAGAAAAGGRKKRIR